MKELNQKLSECYKEILGETAITAPFGQDGLSSPLLIKFADEQAVKTADLKVMFFGQETKDAESGTIAQAMDTYQNFFNDFNEYTEVPDFYCWQKYRSTPFWNVLNQMKNIINGRLPNKQICCIYNNICKADYKGGKVPNNVYVKFRDINRALIVGEIEIIKPDVLVFFTGAESSQNDKKIDDVFNNGASILKDEIDIDGNKNVLAKMSLPGYGEAYISNHPRWLMSHPEAKDFVLNAIAEQCEKAITDTNK